MFLFFIKIKTNRKEPLRAEKFITRTLAEKQKKQKKNFFFYQFVFFLTTIW